MLCMGKISAGGARSTLKCQRYNGDVASTPFRSAVRACVPDSDFPSLFALCVFGPAMFLSHEGQQKMPPSEQDEPE